MGMKASQNQAGLFGLGRSKARRYNEDQSRITFDDVAGADEAKSDLQEEVDFLRHPLKYHNVGARIPRGVLLVGPPGTGKTLLARAVAGEAGVPFLSLSASEFVEMFVGVGADQELIPMGTGERVTRRAVRRPMNPLAAGLGLCVLGVGLFFLIPPVGIILGIIGLAGIVWGAVTSLTKK